MSDEEATFKVSEIIAIVRLVLDPQGNDLSRLIEALEFFSELKRRDIIAKALEAPPR